MSGEGLPMARPVILPASRPLPHNHHVEFGAWCADKLREAMSLGPDGLTEADLIENLLLKAMLR